MRISTSMMQQLGINAILNEQSKLSQTQLQLSTGQRILTPSDDPAGAVQELALNQTIATNNQYQSTIQTAQNRLGFEDTALESADNILQSVRSLAVQSLNGTLTPQDRQALGQQVQQLADQMLSITNTQSANGEYIFSGYRTQTPAYRFDNTLVPPGYTYQGDANQRALQVGASNSVADGDPGSTVFENIPSVGLAATTLGTNTQSVMDMLNTFIDALNGKFTAPHGTVQGTADVSAGVDFTPTPPPVPPATATPISFNLAVDGGAPVTVTIPATKYPDANALVGAINSGIAATSLNTQVSAQIKSGHVQFVSATSGKTSNVTISNNGSGFLTALGFSDPKSGSGADLGTDPFAQTVNASLTDIDAALQRILDKRASVGARLNALDTQQNVNAKFVLDAQTNRSQIADLDYAEAISRFNLQQVSLQAAQQAYVKVQGLSLFNYLR